SKLRLGNRDLKADRRDYRPSEGQGVVVLVEGRGRRSGRRLPAPRARIVAARRTAAAAAEHDHLPHDDVGPVADVALVVLGLRVLEATLDVEAVALVYVLLDEVGQPIEERAAVPLGLLLLLAAAIGEGAI